MHAPRHRHGLQAIGYSRRLHAWASRPHALTLTPSPSRPHALTASRPHARTPLDGQASQWQRIKGSLLRDSRGQFKIVIKEDGGGFYFDTIAQTDVSDDREKFRPRDYLVSIGRKAVDEFTLPMVRGVIKEAGSMLEVEVRRYAPNEARGEARREQERRQELSLIHI